MEKPNNTDEYIAAFPENVQQVLKQLRETIREAAPQAEEAFSYNIPTYKIRGKNLVHFGGHKKHIGFYPTPSGIDAFKDELSKYKSAKGSVQFPLNEPFPYDLVSRIVRFRVEEMTGN